MYRPFLKMVVDREVTIGQVSAEIVQYAQLCIRAMINSTIAFEASKSDQSITSDIWDTAHT